MTRDALIRALRRYAKSIGLAFSFDASKGKGGHGQVSVAERMTTVKGGELTNIYVQEVLKQLGLSKDAI